MTTAIESGKWVRCGACVNGLVDSYGDGPRECPHCNCGVVWRYHSGALALYPGGPFCGYDKPPTMKEA